MNKPAWHRVKEILEGALEQSPADRSAFVARSCDDDRALREEVESLLTSIEQSGDFIERPAFESLRDSVASGIGTASNANERVLEPDDSLGPYTILEFVGAGGMGQVYRAHDTNLNRDVALKVRSNASAWDNDRFTHFRREAQILAALNHPNIAAIYGIETSGATQALVLEFVEGPTLASRIRSGRIPVGEVLLFARQIAEGLEAAHKRGIIHRDLKPANIKLCPNGTAKILDFGLAKALDAVDAALPPERGAEESSGISHAGLVFGTAAYMSPEQARGEAVDKRTDIWAFGCVVYESLTGVPAFAGDTIPETIKAVLETAPQLESVAGRNAPFRCETAA
jgi:serine/threonine protein kinase